MGILEKFMKNQGSLLVTIVPWIPDLELILQSIFKHSIKVSNHFVVLYVINILIHVLVFIIISNQSTKVSNFHVINAANNFHPSLFSADMLKQSMQESNSLVINVTKNSL